MVKDEITRFYNITQDLIVIYCICERVNQSSRQNRKGTAINL